MREAIKYFLGVNIQSKLTDDFKISICRYADDDNKDGEHKHDSESFTTPLVEIKEKVDACFFINQVMKLARAEDNENDFVDFYNLVVVFTKHPEIFIEKNIAFIIDKFFGCSEIKYANYIPSKHKGINARSQNSIYHMLLNTETMDYNCSSLLQCALASLNIICKNGKKIKICPECHRVFIPYKSDRVYCYYDDNACKKKYQSKLVHNLNEDAKLKKKIYDKLYHRKNRFEEVDKFLQEAEEKKNELSPSKYHEWLVDYFNNTKIKGRK